MFVRSLQILWNSVAGIRTTAAYSVSGIPRCSLSMSMSLSSKSDIRSFSTHEQLSLAGQTRQVDVVRGDQSHLYHEHSRGCNTMSENRVYGQLARRLHISAVELRTCAFEDEGNSIRFVPSRKGDSIICCSTLQYLRQSLEVDACSGECHGRQTAVNVELQSRGPVALNFTSRKHQQHTHPCSTAYRIGSGQIHPSRASALRARRARSPSLASRILIQCNRSLHR